MHLFNSDNDSCISSLGDNGSCNSFNSDKDSYSSSVVIMIHAPIQ